MLVYKAVVTTSSGLRFDRALDQNIKINIKILSYTYVMTRLLHCRLNKQAAREAATICPAPVTLTFDLLTLKVVSESRVTWATSVPILVFLGLSVLDLGPICATDKRQRSDRQTSDSN